MCEVINESYPKARKDHICDLCRCTIKKRHKYVRQFNRDGGDVWTFKAHIECCQLANKLEVYSYEELEDELDNILYQDKQSIKNTNRYEQVRLAMDKITNNKIK